MHLSRDSPHRATTQIVCRECLPACGGSLPHVTCLIDGYLNKFLHQDAFTAACKRGAAIDNLEFFLAWTQPNWAEAVDVAARGGHVHVLQWMATDRQDHRGPWKTDFNNALYEAVGHGHFDVVKWLHEFSRDISAYYAMSTAASNGYLEIVQWLNDHRPESRSPSAIYCAARYGHLAVVQWLHEHLAESHSQSAISAAAGHGHLNVVQWLAENCPDACTADALNSAALRGQLHVVQWLYNHGGKIYTASGPKSAASSGNLKMVQWLHEHFNDQFSTAAMDAAAKFGHLSVVQWLHENRPEGCTRRAMDWAACCGHLEVVQWLHENRTEGCTTHTMDDAASNGYLDVVQWLHEKRHEGCTARAKNWAASKGHLQVVQWLHKNRSEGCTTTNMDQAACNGHLDVIRYLHEHRIGMCTSVGMQRAVENGHFEVVRYLYDNQICRECGRAIRDAVDRGRLDVVKVLVQNGHYVDWELALGPVIDKWVTESFGRARQDRSSVNGEANRNILEGLEWFHSYGYDECVSLILKHALKRGHPRLVRCFFEHVDYERASRHTWLSQFRWGREMLGWLLENGHQLDIQTALKFIQDHGYVEVLWWLSESLRVSIVCDALLGKLKKWQVLIVFVFKNTRFEQETSLQIIRDALQQAPGTTTRWFAANAEIREVCPWIRF